MRYEVVCMDAAGFQAVESGQCKAEVTCESSYIGDEETCEEETWAEEHCSNTGKNYVEYECCRVLAHI